MFCLAEEVEKKFGFFFLAFEKFIYVMACLAFGEKNFEWTPVIFVSEKACQGNAVQFVFKFPRHVLVYGEAKTCKHFFFIDFKLSRKL